MKNFTNLFFFSISIFFLFSCKKTLPQSVHISNQINKQNNSEIDSIKDTVLDTLTSTFIDTSQVKKKVMTYTSWKIRRHKKSRNKFKSTFSKTEKKTIAKLNRTDLKHLYRRDSLMVPNEFLDNFLEYSPFPATVELLDEVNKFIIFSYPIQSYAVYEKGELVRWGPTNMGKRKTQTPRGLFFSNWKGRKVKSSVNETWILEWNFNISNKGGVGWHQYSLPGYPASHACMRLLREDAKWLYHWADQWVLKNDRLVLEGTPVVIYGDYNFSKNGIWHQLAQDPTVTNVSEEALNNIIKPYLNKISIKQKKRYEYYNIDKEQTKQDTVKKHFKNIKVNL